ncbi:MAG: gamma-glutamyltransferase, partial [Bdellovibrionota bacterium]
MKFSLPVGLIFFLMIAPVFGAWEGEPEQVGLSRVKPVVGTRGMVVSDDLQASEWGAEILRQGGNAIDAAVATGFMLSVTRPHYASLGGGGFMVFCPAPGTKGRSPCTVIDYRERAPQAAKRDMFLKEGKPDLKMSQDGATASGIPGAVAGLLEAHEKFGKTKRAKLLSKPIAIARSGIRMTGLMESFAYGLWSIMNSAAKNILGCQGNPCSAGKLLKEDDLAHTLEAISIKGREGFYKGEVAGKLIQGLKAANGVLTLEDLASYQAMIREPLVGKYKEFEIVSMPPPSAGGTVILQLFGFAERADEAGAFSKGLGSVSMVHAIAHGMMLGFADRAKYFG